jgi:5-methylcytosine-specific restriction endonuclease McrA
MTNARDLAKKLGDLLRREHEAMADFLAALADFDRDRTWMELGYTSLFYFLHRELGLSKGSAHYRKTAAELVQRFPGILEPLRDGRLCLTSVVELSKVLTPENEAEVLPRFFHLSRNDAMAVVAELQPREAPPFRTMVTAAPLEARVAVHPAAVDPMAPLALAACDVTLPRTMDDGGSVSAANRLPHEIGFPGNLVDANSAPAPRKSSPEVEPLTADLRRFHITVSKRFLEKLASARDALSQSMPLATEEEILEAGLDRILAERARKRGIVSKPRKEPPPSHGDGIPAHVRRAVWERDGGRCSYPMPGGGVCGSTRRLELDHLHAKALGGKATADNLAVRCRPHNLANARETFGDALIDLYTRNPRKPHGAREPVASYG